MNEVNNTGLVGHIYLSPYIIHLVRSSCRWIVEIIV